MIDPPGGGNLRCRGVIKANKVGPHSCQIKDKYFPVFTLDPHRPCSDLPLISVLTSQPIYDHFELDCK